jgi:hypothetical protein
MSTIEVSTVTSLDDLALALLEVAEDALADTEGGTPDVIFNSVGPPPFDCCPMLAVHVPSLGVEPMNPSGPPMATGRQASYGRLNLASLIITATRCAPTIKGGETPSVSEMNAAANLVRQDMWVLWNAIYHAIKNGDFKDTCSDVHIDRAQAIPEQGGCAGVQVIVRAELHGIPNPGSS